MHIAIQKMIVFFSVQYYVFLTISTPSPLSLYFFFIIYETLFVQDHPFFRCCFFSLFVIYNSYILRPPVIYIVKSLLFKSNFWRIALDLFFLVFALNLVNVNCKRLFMWIVYVYWSVNCDSYVDKHGNCDRAGSVN